MYRFESVTDISDGMTWQFTQDGRPVEVRTTAGFSVATQKPARCLRILRALMTRDEMHAFEAGEGVAESSLVGRTLEVIP